MYLRVIQNNIKSIITLPIVDRITCNSKNIAKKSNPASMSTNAIPIHISTLVP